MIFTNSRFMNLKQEGITLPKEKRVLALMAPRRSGKTWVANLVKKIDERFKKKSFADPLRQLYADVHNVTVEALLASSSKEKYRADLIDFSYRIKKDRGLFCFAEDFFNTILETPVICDDLRIIEELQLLCMFGGVGYRVFAPDYLRRKWGWEYNPLVDDERSEMELGHVSGYTLWSCTGGGILYNTRENDAAYLEDQLIPVIKTHFPEKLIIQGSTDLERLINLEM